MSEVLLWVLILVLLVNTHYDQGLYKGVKSCEKSGAPCQYILDRVVHHQTVNIGRHQVKLRMRTEHLKSHKFTQM